MGMTPFLVFQSVKRFAIMSRKPIDKESLYLDYMINRVPTAKIAKKYGIHPPSLYYWLNLYEIPRRGTTPRINLSGKKIGSYKVISFSRLGNKTRWLCKCGCGFETLIGGQQLRDGTYNRCKLCCEHQSWRGYEEMSKSFLSRLKLTAEKRDIVFAVSPQYIWGLFLKQDRRCALSGILLSFGTPRKRKLQDITASLDRIDSTKGYVRGNVQWLHKEVNFLKNDFTEKELLRWCELIYKHNKRERSAATNENSRTNASLRMDVRQLR